MIRSCISRLYVKYAGNVLQFFPTAEGYVKATKMSLGNTYDGVDLYTFTLLPMLDIANTKRKINFDCQISNKSVSFLLPQHEEFLLYKFELNKKGWNNDEDLILVKVSYEILNPKWKEYVKIESKKITIENKDYEIEDYDFYNLVNNRGEALYEIKNIEYIKKIN